MKKTVLFLTALFAAWINVQADSTLAVADATIPQGGTGTINIELNNDKAYTAFTFTLTLPEGISYDSFTKGDRFADSHSVSANVAGQNVNFGCLSTSNESITGTSGTLLTVKLTADAGLAIDETLVAKLKNLNFSTTSGEETLSDVNINLTIGDPRILLDENSTTAPEAASDVNVRVLRTINANTWSTICLPFDMTSGQVTAAFGNDVELADFTSYDTEEDTDENIIGLTVNFDPVTAIEANHPYIIKVSDAITEFSVNGVTIDPDPYPCVEYDNGKTGKKREVWGTFAGTYVADFDFYQDAYDNDEQMALFLNGGKFYYATASTKHMKAFRGYFYFVDALKDTSLARAVLSINGNGTKISNVDFLPTQNGRVYSISGQYLGEASEMPKLQKGVYVIDGKKMVIK